MTYFLRNTDFTGCNLIPCLSALLMHVFKDNFELDKAIPIKILFKIRYNC